MGIRIENTTNENDKLLRAINNSRLIANQDKPIKIVVGASPCITNDIEILIQAIEHNEKMVHRIEPEFFSPKDRFLSKRKWR